MFLPIEIATIAQRTKDEPTMNLFTRLFRIGRSSTVKKKSEMNTFLNLNRLLCEFPCRHILCNGENDIVNKNNNEMPQNAYIWIFHNFFSHLRMKYEWTKELNTMMCRIVLNVVSFVSQMTQCSMLLPSHTNCKANIIVLRSDSCENVCFFIFFW